MIQGAKITMDYQEFRMMEDRLEKAEREVEKNKKRFEELLSDLESDKYVRALEDIERELIKAHTVLTKTLAASRLTYINNALDIYCKVFDIPSREELI